MTAEGWFDAAPPAPDAGPAPLSDDQWDDVLSTAELEGEDPADNVVDLFPVTPVRASGDLVVVSAEALRADATLAALAAEAETFAATDRDAAREWGVRDDHQADVARAAQAERNLRATEDRQSPMTAEEIEADPVARILLSPSPDRPRVFLDRLGPSYLVVVRPLGARFLFRDVRTDHELGADVTVGLAGRHLFRTTVTLSLTGRDKVAKTAADLAGGNGPAWRLATFAAVEAVLEAEERLGAPVDLRTASLALPTGGLHVARPVWPIGSMVMTAPGDAGKSTIGRAMAVSLAGDLAVLPGVEPVGGPRPVLYVAGEDPVVYWHSRSVEAICRGLGVDRASLAQPIELYDAAGRPLHRIARAIAERAADFGAVILDSHQSLLAAPDATGGIRDRDSLFWHGVDQSGRPTAIIAHPNRADAQAWNKADGRIAGSEVNRDRARMAWRATFTDEPAVIGTSFRRYTLVNVKNNHGPREEPLAFAAAWEFGLGGDPGVLRFMATDPASDGDRQEDREPTPVEQATLEAYRAGARTPAELGRVLKIEGNAAKARLRRLRERGFIEDGEGES